MFRTASAASMQTVLSRFFAVTVVCIMEKDNRMKIIYGMVYRSWIPSTSVDPTGFQPS